MNTKVNNKVMAHIKNEINRLNSLYIPSSISIEKMNSMNEETAEEIFEASFSQIKDDKNLHYFISDLLDLYPSVSTSQRETIRNLFEKNSAFSQCTFIDEKGKNFKEYIFKSLLLLSIKDYMDFYDILNSIQYLYDEAEKNNESSYFREVANQIAFLSSNIDRQGKGSMKQILKSKG